MKYTIITPVYNRADCIARCIDSIIRNLGTTYEVEHVIVDDGSSDNTADIILSYTTRYSHIHFIQLPQNKGTNAARNAAIKIATGDFCIILDSDDYLTNDAIQTIGDTMTANKGYIHYLFAPQDMQRLYAVRPTLTTNSRIELSYFDFLSKDIAIDYIHVIKTETLQLYPFDEYLRIYEGIFLLRFYRHAQKILFTNQVVAIRERSRQDSVTRTVFRTTKDTIKKHIYSGQLMLNWFADDYIKYNLQNKLYNELAMLFENHVLLSEYSEAKDTLSIIEKYGMSISGLIKYIYQFHLGNIYRHSLRIYLKLKFDILRTRLN